ncbi:MAG: hypothetical protein EA376_05730 [Phycisphaeraceae bacterium]|nr:MAG: hypothetical protein EA376_05730 [Phycisphaeraceae bacterium]
MKRTTEPGLSLVIPWLDDDVTYEDLLAAVVDQYYYAILSGVLAVELTDGDSDCTLSRSTIAEIVRSKSRLRDHVAMIELASWSMKFRQSERLTLNVPHPDAAQKWAAELVPEEVRTGITQRLLRRERVAVRIPVHVYAKGDSVPERSHFDLYLEHHDESKQIRPSFVREQLLINDVKRAVGVPKIRPLVVIDDKPLAALLRAAEPPSHADWSASTGNFKNVYHNGNHVITFVKTAVTQLMSIVRAGDEEPDPTITIDFFALPEPDDRPTPPGGREKKKQPGDDSDKKIGPLPRNPRRFAIAEVAGGFVVRPGEPGTTLPSRLRVAMAYDVLSGSPWKQYEPADFDLTRRDRNGIQIAASGDVEFKVADSNQIHLKLTGPEFELYVTGFDRNRDLIVRAYDPKEPPDADSAAELHETEEAHG